MCLTWTLYNYVESTSFPVVLFFFNDTATTEIYTLSLHDALPICACRSGSASSARPSCCGSARASRRSEEHTSELQSHSDLVCRLLLEKKNQRCKCSLRRLLP